MGIQEFKPISKVFSWIFLFSLLNFFSGIHSLGLTVHKKAYVALAGETVSLEYHVNREVNQSTDYVLLKCFSPRNLKIQQRKFYLNLETTYAGNLLTLTNVNTSNSGLYRCELSKQGLKPGESAYWFLLVRDHGHQTPGFQGMVTVGVLTALLGISSIAGSLYLLREHVSLAVKRGGLATEGEDRVEHREPAAMGATATAPASVYASLEARPGSIYDTLEPTTEKHEASVSAKGTKDKPPGADQNQGVFECLYENF